MKEKNQNSAKKDQKSAGFRSALYIQIPKLDDKLKELTEGVENLKLNSNFITPTLTPRTSDPKTFEFLKDCISSDLLRRLEESSPIKCNTPVLQRRISDIFLVNCNKEEKEVQILSNENKKKNDESENTSKNQSPEVNFDENTLDLKKFTHSKKNFLPKFSTIENPNFSPSFFNKNENQEHPAIPLNMNLIKCDSPKFKSIKYADSNSSPIYNYYNDTSEYFSQFFSGDYNNFNKVEKKKNSIHNQTLVENIDNSEIMSDNSNYFQYYNFNSREENNSNFNHDLNNQNNFDFNFTNKVQNKIINNSLEKYNNTSYGIENDHNMKFQKFNKLPLKENSINNVYLQENQNKFQNNEKCLENFYKNMNGVEYNINELEKNMEAGHVENDQSPSDLIEKAPNEKFLKSNHNQNPLNRENQNKNFFYKITHNKNDEYPSQAFSFDNNIKNYETINQTGNFYNHENINDNQFCNPNFLNNINFSFGNKDNPFFNDHYNMNGNFNCEDSNHMNNSNKLNNMKINNMNFEFNENNDQFKNQFWQKNFGKNKAVNIEKMNGIPNLNKPIKKVNNNIVNPNNNYSSKFDPEEYIVEMFGKRGWICQACNNFNYETRSKCNRCGIPKIPKKITNKKNKFNLNNSNFENGNMKYIMNESISNTSNNINNLNSNNPLNYKIKSNLNNNMKMTHSINSLNIHNSEVNLNNNTSFIHNSQTDNLNTSVISNDKKNKKQLVERLGDWDCFRCKNLNFSFRNVCNRCHLDKIESDNLNKEFSINYANYLRFNEMMQNRILMNNPMNYFQYPGFINNNSMNISNIHQNSIQTNNRFLQGIPQNINYYNNFFSNANINITPMNSQQSYFNDNQEPNHNNSKYNEGINYYGNKSDYNELDSHPEI